MGILHANFQAYSFNGAGGGEGDRWKEDRERHAVFGTMPLQKIKVFVIQVEFDLETCFGS